MAAKNLCAKTRPASDPYEVWVAGSWTWRVLKKWQADDHKPYARWFCLVTSPMCPEGEMGDCYAAEIMSSAVRMPIVKGDEIVAVRDQHGQPALTVVHV